MSTVATLLSLVDSLYPNAVSVEDKIQFMNIAINELSPHFGGIAEDNSLLTIANQDAYNLPSGVFDVSDITVLSVSKSDTPLNRYEFVEYKLNHADQNPKSDTGYYQIYDATGAKQLVLYPIPTESNRIISIRYKRRIPYLSAGDLNNIPSFDSRYHEALAFYCCHAICSMGSSPDSYQADMFMAKYDTVLTKLWRVTIEEDGGRKQKRRDNKQWHNSRSCSTGQYE